MRRRVRENARGNRELMETSEGIGRERERERNPAAIRSNMNFGAFFSSDLRIGLIQKSKVKKTKRESDLTEENCRKLAC